MLYTILLSVFNIVLELDPLFGPCWDQWPIGNWILEPLDPGKFRLLDPEHSEPLEYGVSYRLLNGAIGIGPLNHAVIG